MGEDHLVSHFGELIRVEREGKKKKKKKKKKKEKKAKERYGIC